MITGIFMLDKEGRAAKEAAAQLIKLQKAKALARIKQGETVNTVSIAPSRLLIYSMQLVINK
jgi:hypothetical protein